VPKNISDLCSILFHAARHLHGLTRTARPLLLAAADRTESTLPAAERRIVRRALDRVGDCQDRRAVDEEGTAARIAAVLTTATALSRPGIDFIALADGGECARLLVSGEVPNATILAPWNRLAPRLLSIVAATGGEDVRLITGDLPMAEATRRILRRQFEMLTTRAYGLGCSRDIEFVHEIRVATRRMRAALQTFKRAFLGEPLALKGRLKSLAGELGVVRDLDVYLGFLAPYVVESPSDFGSRLVRAARRTRQRAYATMLTRCELPRIASAIRRAPGERNALLPLIPFGERAICKTAPKLLHVHLKRLRRRKGKLRRLSAVEQHRLRIECKKLRYAAEFLADIYPPKLVESVVEPATALQDALGEVHDCDVFVERIGNHARRLRSPDSAALQAMLDHLARRRAEHVEIASSVWRRFHKQKTQDRIDRLIRSPRTT